MSRHLAKLPGEIAKARLSYPPQSERDVEAALTHFQELEPVAQQYTSNAGEQEMRLSLKGTIRCTIQGTVYHIPVLIWLGQNHPYEAPVVFVDPSQGENMQVTPSISVLQSGQVVNHACIDQWDPGNGLHLLVTQLVSLFSHACPIHSRPAAQPARPQQQQQYRPPGQQYTQQYGQQPNRYQPQQPPQQQYQSPYQVPGGPGQQQQPPYNPYGQQQQPSQQPGQVQGAPGPNRGAIGGRVIRNVLGYGGPPAQFGGGQQHGPPPAVAEQQSRVTSTGSIDPKVMQGLVKSDVLSKMTPQLGKFHARKSEEIAKARQTKGTLEQRQRLLAQMQTQLAREIDETAAAIRWYERSRDQLQASVDTMRAQAGSLDADEAVVPVGGPNGLYQQLIELEADIKAIEMTLFEMQRRMKQEPAPAATLKTMMKKVELLAGEKFVQMETRKKALAIAESAPPSVR